MSDDSAKELIGTIGGFLSCFVFWCDAVIANDRLINHLSRRTAQHRGTDRIPVLKDTRLLFYFLAVWTSVGYCGTSLLQMMVFPPIETNSTSSDLLDCLFIAVYLSTVAMVYHTTWDGVSRVQRLTSRTVVSSLGPSKQQSQLTMHTAGLGAASISSQSQRGGITPNVSSRSDKKKKKNTNSSSSKNKKEQDYRAKNSQQDADVVNKFYVEPKISTVSMSTKNSSASSHVHHPHPEGGSSLEKRASQLSATEDSRAALRMASRGSGTFVPSDEEDNIEDDDEESRASAVQTGSFLEGYDDEEEWGTGFEQMNANQQQYDQFGSGGDSNRLHSSMASAGSVGVGVAGVNDPPPTSADLIDDDSEECFAWMRDNRCALTMAVILGYYSCTTILDFIWVSATGTFISFGSYGSVLACVVFGLVSAAGGVSCVMVYRSLSESAAAAAETLQRLASIFFILAVFLIGRSVIVFQPIQDKIGASLLPATLYLMDALSILLLLLRVPKTK